MILLSDEEIKRIVISEWGCGDYMNNCKPSCGIDCVEIARPAIKAQLQKVVKWLRNEHKFEQIAISGLLGMTMDELNELMGGEW